MIDFYLARALVVQLLEHPYGHDWSIQGLGMLRLYLSNDTRLHVWNPNMAEPNVSTMHTHPWHFESLVVFGEIRQNRYQKDRDGETWNCQRILCGEGGGLCGTPREVALVKQPEERYGPGTSYSQHSYEIHDSRPTPGTVTIVRRRFLKDPDHAEVFWPEGEEWVSAEPRPATRQEVESFIEVARRAWS